MFYSVPLHGLYLVSGWFAHKNREKMSPAEKAILDTPVIGCDKAMNCRWRLTSKELNEETGFVTAKSMLFFSPLSFFSFYFYTSGFLGQSLSGIYAALEWEGFNWYDCYSNPSVLDICIINYNPYLSLGLCVKWWGWGLAAPWRNLPLSLLYFHVFTFGLHAANGSIYG